MFDIEVRDKTGKVVNNVGDISVMASDKHLQKGETFSFEFGLSARTLVAMATTDERGDTSLMGSLSISGNVATIKAQAPIIIITGKF